MIPAVAPPRARAARAAVSVLFLANGAFTASILPRLPAIKEGLSLSNAELGAAVAAMPVGGLLAGGLVGVLIARFGSGRVAVLGGMAAAGTLALVGLSASWATLALAYLVLGAFDACMDASMNAHGVGVQRQYGRSILQGFHGMWSLGGMCAGAVGAVAAAAGVPVSVHLACVAAVLATAVLIAGGSLLPASVADTLPGEPEGVAAEPLGVRSVPRLLRVLVPIAMLGILCALLQSAAATWSAVYLTEVLHQPAGIAATAFVLYMGAMVVGRMTNDRWVDRWGSTQVVRAGALVGAAGLVLAIGGAPLALAPLAFLGFAAIGIGSSAMFPVMIGAAGTRPGIPAGHGIAIASWLVRSGMIVAPAVVGVAADAAGLAAALAIPLAAGIVIALLAEPLTGARRRPAPVRAAA